VSVHRGTVQGVITLPDSSTAIVTFDALTVSGTLTQLVPNIIEGREGGGTLRFNGTYDARATERYAAVDDDPGFAPSR
jgi:hypothetical protein